MNLFQLQETKLHSGRTSSFNRGAVIFSRGDTPKWIKAVWQMPEEAFTC